MIRCPVCSTPAGAYFVGVGEWKICKCADCGLEHTHPIPSQQALFEFYENYSDPRARPDVVALNARRNLELLRSLGWSADSSVLDYGAGAGEFVDVAGANCLGIELPGTREPHARIYEGISELPGRLFDFITLWGVLEHLADPVGVVRDLSRLLGAGGYLILTTVDAEGSIPYHYKPIEHLTYWTSKSMSRMFDAAGLTLVSYETYQMVQDPRIYFDRLFARSPSPLRPDVAKVSEGLPQYVEVPTNEVIACARLA